MRAVGVLGCAFALSVAAVPAASAQLVDRSQERGTFTIPDDEVCGIAVTTTVTFSHRELVRIAQSGFPLFQGTDRGTVTWTNPANGKSVSNSWAGLSYKDLTVVDNGDGTITLTTQVTGLPEMLTTDGAVLNMDAGRIVFVSVLDYNGTPTDVEDDIQLSQTVVSESGPHPDLDSNFTLFCEDVVAALT